MSLRIIRMNLKIPNNKVMKINNKTHFKNILQISNLNNLTKKKIWKMKNQSLSI